MPIRTKPRKLSINIGIDFGTCYSKVCFEDETRKKSYVKFYIDQPQYKISEVYYDYANKIFHYQKPKDERSMETIKYFKYSMIDKSLLLSNQISASFTKTVPEILCSVFFIACLLKESKEYIEKHFKEYGILQFDWNITMGVPVDNYSIEIKPLYDLILQTALKLSEELNKYSISMGALDNFCLKNFGNAVPGFKKSQNNTLSELYAECIAFLEDINVLEGLYAIVDIGGATVDMAVISKTSDEDSQSNKTKYKYGIIAKSIIPLGIEILMYKIAKNMDSYSDIKKLLENDGFKNTAIEYNKIEEEKLAREMREAFARLAKEAKDKRLSREALIKQEGKLRVVLCGGGAEYKWYRSCISSVREQILRTLEGVGYKLVFESVDNLKRYYKIIDHRLIISSGLAQDIQRIPDLDGFPWDYPEIKYNERNQNEFLENIMKGKYGKNL